MKTFVFAGEVWPVCSVTITGPGKFKVYCNRCERPLGTFSQHESAMNWAQAHARSKVHRTAGGEQ